MYEFDSSITTHWYAGMFIKYRTLTSYMILDWWGVKNTKYIAKEFNIWLSTDMGLEDIFCIYEMGQNLWDIQNFRYE